MILVDTPGFNDTNVIERNDTKILAQIVDWMKASYGEKKLSGIIYLHSISDVRMTGASITNLRMFRKLVGDENLNNVILATTRWGVTPYEDAVRREEELCNQDAFWKSMIAGGSGSKVRRFENTAASAAELVKEVLQMGQETFVPQIQKEVVLQGKNLSSTGAGEYIDRALNEQKRKYEEEKSALKEEIEWARKNRQNPDPFERSSVSANVSQKKWRWSRHSRNNVRSSCTRLRQRKRSNVNCI